MKNVKQILFVGCLLMLLYSCQEDDVFEDIEKESTIIEKDQLGEKLENPFSVSNMRKALDSLKSKNKQYRSIDFELETTHLYIRFKPKDEQELNVLEADTTLILYSFPLDRKIPEGLTSYHDASIPKDKPTFQYCAVPISYDFPHDIKVKILEELYLPEEDQRTSVRSLGNLLYDLEKEAFAITGNEFDKGDYSNKSGRMASFQPSGTIKIWDDVIGQTTTYSSVFSHWVYYDCGGPVPRIENTCSDKYGIKTVKPIEEDPDSECRYPVYKTVANPPTPGSLIPVTGIKVRARRWFTTKTEYTDENGEFNFTHSFGGDVNYLIVWESSTWDIRDGNLTQAYYNGPQKSSPWNLNINGGKSLRFATIHRACHRYTFEDVDNLSRPILRPGYKVKINYNDGEGTGVNWRQGWQGVDFGSGLLPNIKIWGKNENTGLYHATNQLFSIVIHELAHTTHIDEMFGIIDFSQVSDIIQESWPEAVEWYLTRKEYVERGETDYDDPDDFNTGDHKQWWQSDRHSNEYTPLFIDLVDNYNQSVERTLTFAPNENISGYWMQTIEDVVLKDAYGLTSLRNELKRHKPSGVTDAQIDDYMAFYFNNL